MASSNWKLVSPNINISISFNCTQFCDPNHYKHGFCPPVCMFQCSSTCRSGMPTQIPSPIPPSSPDPHDKEHQKISPIFIASLSVLGVISFLLCCYFIYWYLRQRSRRRPAVRDQELGETLDEFFDEERGPVFDHPIWYIRTVGLNPLVIGAITVCKYKRGEGLVEGTECSVCLNEFQEDETLRLLPKCNHAFHLPCIDTWLRSHTNCPLCRAGIVVGTVQLPPEPPPVANQVVIPESSEGLRREREIEASAGQLQVESGGKSPESSEEEDSDGGNLGFGDAQPVRRSISMDSLSASVVNSAMASAQSGEFAGNSGTQLAKVIESNMGFTPKKVDINQSLMRLVGSSSIGRSLQRGPVSMKRSVSCSGKVLMSRHSRSRSSLPA